MLPRSSTSQGGLVAFLRDAAIIAAVTAVLLAAVETTCYAMLTRTAWFDSWEYVTREDASFGFTLRPGVRSGWTGVPIAVNRSRLRGRDPRGVTPPRVPGERIVLCIGDSNTFGNGVRLEETYPTRLASSLAASTDGPVRVLNLGVPGHTSRQSLAWLESWLHVEPDAVVFSDSFNNRVHWEAAQLDRLHEIGGRIVYTAVYLRELFGRPIPPRVPLDEELPEPRVSLDEYAQILDRVAVLSREHDFGLVFLATGDSPDVAGHARVALQHARRGRWRASADAFDVLRASRPEHFLAWYHEHRALVRGGWNDAAEQLRGAYAELPMAGGDYLGRFVRFARDYTETMGHVAAERAVPLLEMEPLFREDRVRFYDITHFDAHGHDRVAQELAKILPGTW